MIGVDRVFTSAGSYEPMQEAAKNLLLVLVALFPKSWTRSAASFFLALDQEYSPESAKSIVWRIA